MTTAPLACSLVLTLIVAAAAQKSADDLPEAEGRDAVADTCTACHSLSRVMSNRLEKAAWLQRIANHKSRGLDLSAEEAQSFADYLSAYFGPLVNINRATPAELMALPSIDEKLAHAIVRHRTTNGPFSKLEDLKGVAGAKWEVVDKLRYRLVMDVPGRETSRDKG
jgi:competence ComEA-like helix-hairpin-helix protein